MSSVTSNRVGDSTTTGGVGVGVGVGSSTTGSDTTDGSGAGVGVGSSTSARDSMGSALSFSFKDSFADLISDKLTGAGSCRPVNRARLASIDCIFCKASCCA